MQLFVFWYTFLSVFIIYYSCIGPGVLPASRISISLKEIFFYFFCLVLLLLFTLVLSLHFKCKYRNLLKQYYIPSKMNQIITCKSPGNTWRNLITCCWAYPIHRWESLLSLTTSRTNGNLPQTKKKANELQTHPLIHLPHRRAISDSAISAQIWAAYGHGNRWLARKPQVTKMSPSPIFLSGVANMKRLQTLLDSTVKNCYLWN